MNYFVVKIQSVLPPKTTKNTQTRKILYYFVILCMQSAFSCTNKQIFVHLSCLLDLLSSKIIGYDVAVNYQSSFCHCFYFLLISFFRFECVCFFKRTYYLLLLSICICFFYCDTHILLTHISRTCNINQITINKKTTTTPSLRY